MNAPYAPQPTASNATLALVLGILGIVFCPLCAPFAWNLGAKAEREDAGGQVGGRGVATAGKILGIIGTILLILAVLALLVLLLLVVLLPESAVAYVHTLAIG